VYFKLHITDNNGGTHTQVGEWQLFGDIDFDPYYNEITDNGGVLTTSGNTATLNALTDNDAASIYSTSASGLPVWIQYKATTPVQIMAYSITSGDVIADAPKSWVLQGSNDGESWTNIQSKTNEVFDLRYIKKSYAVSTSNTYTYFRLQINALFDANATEVRIAEWELFGTSISSYDITSHSTGVLTAQFPGNTNEKLDRLTDKSRTGKYCVSNQKTFWAKYETPRAARLIAYSLTSANDAPDRDPKSWILYGSNDDSNWTEIDRRTNEDFQYRYATQYYLTPTNAKYSFFKLDVTGNNGANTIQLAEWQLFGEYNEYAADITENGGILTASHPASNGTSLQALTDNKEATKYYLSIPSFTNGVWFTYQSPAPVALKHYTLTSADDTPNNDPKTWTLQASNNGTDWTNIDTQSDIIFVNRCERKVFPASSGTAYTYYRLSVTERFKNADRGFHLAEWELFDTDNTAIIVPERTKQTTISPNPAVNDVTVSLTEKSFLSLFDMQGRLLYTQQAEPRAVTIPVNTYQPGVYLLRITSGNASESHRFIKK
jgi:hypothetical protein